MNRVSTALFVLLSLSLKLTALAVEPSQHVLDSILLHQRNSGGWPKNINYRALFNTTVLLKAKTNLDSTFDNGATTEEMEILARAYRRTANNTYRRAVLSGLRFRLKAQYDNGGWPQRFPDTNGYHGQITFNDNAMINVMTLLGHVAENERYDFVEQSLRRQARDAVNRGIECILKCQIRVEGRPTVWCAQHDRITYHPAKARSYELPSYSGSESTGIVRFLMGIEASSCELIRSIEGAIHWFQTHEIKGIKLTKTPAPDSPKGWDRIVVADPQASGIWARFYDLNTTQPFFCSRDGVPKNHISEISYERRNGYSWYTSSAENLLKKDYPKWKERNHR